jgi:hypothetical protein
MWKFKTSNFDIYRDKLNEVGWESSFEFADIDDKCLDISN